MGPPWSPDRDQRPEAASSKPQDPRIRAQAWAAKRQAASHKIDKAWALGYYKIMKEDKHIQLNLSEDVEKIMCDYDLILRVNDKGTKFIAFDIFDYVNQKYIFTHKLKKRVKRKICSLKKQKK